MSLKGPRGPSEQDLKNRQLALQGRVEFDSRREKTLEQMVVYRDEPEKKDPDGA